MKKKRINLVDYYFERMEFYRKQKGGKGYTQTDMKKAQEDVKKEWKHTK